MKIHPGKLTLLFTLLLTALAAAADHAPPSIPPDVALARLKAGNHRFVSTSISGGKPTAARRAETAEGQHPFAIIVGCADSRTSPEIVFDQNIGDPLRHPHRGQSRRRLCPRQHRICGGHLGARLIVVLGHQKCGAVQAALAGGAAPGHVHALVKAIQPAVRASKGLPGDPLVNAIQENDLLVAKKIHEKARLGDLASQVRVVEGYYDLHSGKVQWAQ
ncbi:MAG: carbonic anhydrase [Chthoniobacter sp.]